MDVGWWVSALHNYVTIQANPSHEKRKPINDLSVWRSGVGVVFSDQKTVLGAWINMKSLYIDSTSVAELKENIRKLSTEERRELAAFLVTLRHDAIPDYRENLTSLIDDSNEDHWVTIEELDKRLNSWRVNHCFYSYQWELWSFWETPRKQKSLIRKTIAEIESDPSGVGDHLDHDFIGRMVHIKIIGE